MESINEVESLAYLAWQHERDTEQNKKQTVTSGIYTSNTISK